MDFSDCLKNLDTNRRTRNARKEKPVVSISSGESDASGPITRLKPLNKRKTRAIRSSSDDSDKPSTDSVPEIKLKGISNKSRTNRKVITIPDIEKLKDDEIQIVDSPDSMETEFDSRDVIINGKSSRKRDSPVITGKLKRNSASRRITDKPMDQEYVEQKLPRFRKKKPPKKVDEIVDQLVIPPIETPPIEIFPDEPTASKSNSKQNTKMGCLETLEKMEESSDDILEGWGSQNSPPALFASSSHTNRLDGPSRSKRLSRDLQSAPKRSRSHPVFDAFQKSIISPNKNSSDAFVSKISNKVRFDGGRNPRQRTRKEKENYELRHGASAIRSRDSSPNAVIEIYSSTEKKSNRNHIEKRGRTTNVLQLSSDSE